MRNEIKRTNDQIEKDFEDHGFSVMVEDIVLTRDTLESFENNFSGTKLNTGKENVLEMQGRKKSLLVIDYGIVRAVYVTN